jgi:hypothetical protein
MPLAAFWGSVLILRKIEFIATVTVMTVTVTGGIILLTVRHRIKTLQTIASESQTLTYQGNVHNLQTQNRRLTEDLSRSRDELGPLRRVTAPRQLSESQAHIMLAKLRGIQTAPIVVCGFAYEEESATYASQIAAALRQAGLEVTYNKASMNDFKGIGLGEINRLGHPLAGAPELVRAFTDAGIELHRREITPESIAGSLQDGSLLIVVGRK